MRGLWPSDLQIGYGLPGDRLVDDDVVGGNRLAQLCTDVVRIDLAGSAFLRGKLGRGFVARLLLALQFFDAGRGQRRERGRGECLDLLDKLFENTAALSLKAQIGREAPHRRSALEYVDIDLRPERIGVVARRRRNPWNVNIDQQADIDIDEPVGLDSAEMGEGVRDIAEGEEIDDANACEPGKVFDMSEMAGIAAAIGRDEDGVFRCDKPARELLDEVGVGAA